MSVREITLIVNRSLMTADLLQSLRMAKREYLRAAKNSEVVITPRWYLVPIENPEEDDEVSWSTTFGYVLFNLFHKSPFSNKC